MGAAVAASAVAVLGAVAVAQYPASFKHGCGGDCNVSAGIENT